MIYDSNHVESYQTGEDNGLLSNSRISPYIYSILVVPEGDLSTTLLMQEDSPV